MTYAFKHKNYRKRRRQKQTDGKKSILKLYVAAVATSAVAATAATQQQRLIIGSLSIFNCLHVVFSSSFGWCSRQKKKTKALKTAMAWTEKQLYDFHYDNERSPRISEGSRFNSIRVINWISTVENHSGGNWATVEKTTGKATEKRWTYNQRALDGYSVIRNTMDTSHVLQIAHNGNFFLMPTLTL